MIRPTLDRLFLAAESIYGGRKFWKSKDLGQISKKPIFGPKIGHFSGFLESFATILLFKSLEKLVIT